MILGQISYLDCFVFLIILGQFMIDILDVDIARVSELVKPFLLC